MKKLYSLYDELPIPNLKKEIIDNHSDEIEFIYELYNPMNLEQKFDLNLSSENYIEIKIHKIFKKYKMDLILKTKKLGYNIFDLNDSFYNDICSIFSYNNSDFSLSERKNLIDLSDEILCLNGYNYSGYDIVTFRIICLYKIGSNINDTDKSNTKNNDINEENNHLVTLLKQNMDISKSSNIKVVKCFRIIFRKNLFSQNYGFYIMIFLIIFNVLIDINNNKELINKTKKENKETKFNNSIPHKNIILNKTQDIVPIKGAIRIKRN